MKTSICCRRFFSAVCITLFAGCSLYAASYSKLATKKMNEYAGAVWKTAKDNPTATIASLALAGTLLYSAQLYRKLAAAERLQQLQQQQREQLATAIRQFHEIEQRYRPIIDLLELNPKIAQVLSTIDTKREQIMSQLRKIDMAYGSTSDYEQTVRALKSAVPQESSTSTIWWLTIVQQRLKQEMTQHPEIYITQLQANITALYQLINAYPAVAQAAEQAGSTYTLDALITLKRKFLLIQALVNEQLKNDAQAAQTKAKGQGRKGAFGIID